jgi:hypothetical protein
LAKLAIKANGMRSVLLTYCNKNVHFCNSERGICCTSINMLKYVTFESSSMKALHDYNKRPSWSRYSALINFAESQTH